jgi:probable biosynthetic protein (TIGR04099 family)
LTVTTTRSPSNAAPSTREGIVRLGMPQLAYAGLSETWLLKELGDRHWRLIAEAAGLDDPDFRDADNTPLYPAFCGTSIEAAHFDAVREHDDLVISSDLARVSATQWASRHALSRRGAPVGLVSLLSVFVKRGPSGHNRALARTAPAMLARVPVRADFTPITAVASSVRTGGWSAHFGFDRLCPTPRGREVFRPCPAQDFNGAGFLYFPSFTAFVDRTEWSLFGEAAATTVARDVIYCGNLDVGQRLAVDVCAVRIEGDERAHWCSITGDDGRRLAEVFTRKRIRPARTA